jgi:hypothetical protein
MKIYEPKTLDVESTTEYFKTSEENWKQLEEIDARAKLNGSKLYRYITIGIGDGHAFYQIIKVNKTSYRLRVCTGFGDNWIDPILGVECTVAKKAVDGYLKRRDVPLFRTASG